MNVFSFKNLQLGTSRTHVAHPCTTTSVELSSINRLAPRSQSQANTTQATWFRDNRLSLKIVCVCTRINIVSSINTADTFKGSSKPMSNSMKQKGHMTLRGCWETTDMKHEQTEQRRWAILRSFEI